jgi:hypothetical protein
VIAGDELVAGEGSRVVAEATVMELSLWHANDV